MMMITFLVFGSVAAAFVLVMTDWTDVKGKQECFKYKMINRQLQKIRKEADEKEAIQAKWESLKG